MDYLLVFEFVIEFLRLVFNVNKATENYYPNFPSIFSYLGDWSSRIRPNNYLFN